jgi:hypothetical protein
MEEQQTPQETEPTAPVEASLGEVVTPAAPVEVVPVEAPPVEAPAVEHDPGLIQVDEVKKPVKVWSKDVQEWVDEPRIPEPAPAPPEGKTWNFNAQVWE